MWLIHSSHLSKDPQPSPIRDRDTSESLFELDLKSFLCVYDILRGRPQIKENAVKLIRLERVGGP